ncbi:MAG: cyclic 2,3-diphosphoglycerate synthase [Pseudomonadota bacterium]
MIRRRTVIMGAAGRDFHLFNARFRDNESVEVVAFTATQIPFIVGRTYPSEIAGRLYPDGVPIRDESELASIIMEKKVDQVFFAYSDVRYEYVMSRSSIVHAAGADFVLGDFLSTMLAAKVPVISVCAVRTGCGKSQTTRMIASILQERGVRVAVVRHPMPYGKLLEQRCQKFETVADLDRYNCTIEEREEYEPHLERGFLVFAGVDYHQILDAAQKEAGVILWDGGNNDLPFYKPDIHVVVTDPHRVGHERLYFPSELNARLADVFVINKEDSASRENIEKLEKSLVELNPKAKIAHADSPVTVEKPESIKGKRVLCVEDGPTLTHGEMAFGAGILAAKKFGAGSVVDPKPFLSGEMVETFMKYPFIRDLLPAMGYGGTQVKDLAKTINRTPCDTVLIATPIDLRRICEIRHDTCRVTYELEEIGKPDLSDVLRNLKKRGTAGAVRGVPR